MKEDTQTFNQNEAEENLELGTGEESPFENDDQDAINERIDGMFKDIATGVYNSCKRDIGTPDSDDLARARKRALQYENEESYEEVEKPEGKIRSWLHEDILRSDAIGGAFVFILIAMALTFIGCRYWSIHDDSVLETENRQHLKEIAELQSQVESLQDQINNIDTSDYDELKAQTDELALENTTKDAEIADLTSQLEALRTEREKLRLELTEAQFRADMYQEFGMWEW